MFYTHNVSVLSSMNPFHVENRPLEQADDQPQPPMAGDIFPILAETLLRLSTELLNTFDSDKVLGRILALLHHLVPYETAAIHLVDGDRLITQAGVGAALPTVGQMNYRREDDFIWQFVERERRPYLCQDLHREPWKPLAGFEYIRSFMAVPLTIQDEVTGILTLDHSLPNQFNDEQMQVVTLFAHQVSTTVVKARLFEAERQQHRFAESQLAFSYRLMQTSTSDEAIAALLDTLVETTPVDAGSVTLLIPEEANRGYIAAAFGYTSPDKAHHQPVDMRQFELLVQLAHERSPIYLADVRNERRWQPGLFSDGQEVRAILLVPLLADAQSELLGYITLKSYHPDSFSKTMRNNVALLCNQTAGALHILRLLEEARRRLDEVSVLTEMSAHLNRSYELADTLQFVLNRVMTVICQGDRLDQVRGAIILRVPGSDILHLAASHNLTQSEIDTFNNRPYTIAEGTFGRSIGKGEWVEINQPAQVAASIAEQFATVPPRQLLDIPLIVGSETIGIISVDHVVRDPATRQLLVAMTDLAGSAIQKTQALAHSRKRAVELMETYERLQVLDQQRDEFIQNITHDLKAPLTFIRGYAELMAEGALGEINQEQADALDVIQERTDAVNQLIADILTLKNVEAQPLQELPIDLNQIAVNVARNARMAARLAGLEIEVIASQGAVRVQGDGARMEQVFENLLSNAIKYSPDGGKITISVGEHLNLAQVTIADEGMGIPPHEIENIWSRYYRVAGLNVQGTGLGLANVRRIIEAHGGRVWVRSSGKGTTFTFELPLYRTGD